MIQYLFLLFPFIFAELVFIQETFRHGSRYPANPDYNNYSPLLLGELTSIGKRMHYLLGQRLYHDYWNKLNLPDYYDNQYFFVKSTDYNRTIQSAESHIKGILDQIKPQSIASSQYSLPDWRKPESLNKLRFWNNQFISFSEMPIHVAKKNLHTSNFSDFLLNYEFHNCLAQNDWGHQNENSKQYKRMEPILNKYCKFLEEEFKSSSCNITDIIRFVDVYKANTYLGKPVHSIFKDEKNLSELLFLYTQGIYVSYFLQEIQINATITPFLVATRENLYKAISKPRQKWVMYSSHDLTLMNILASMKLGNAKCVELHFFQPQVESKCVWEYPPYASNIIIQLEKQLSNYFVRVRYNGVYMNLPFCINPQNCTFLQFQKFLNQTILQDYQKICKFDDQQLLKIQIKYNNNGPLIKTFTFFLVIDLIYLIYRLIDYCLKNRELPNEEKMNLKNANMQEMEMQQI